MKIGELTEQLQIELTGFHVPSHRLPEHCGYNVANAMVSQPMDFAKDISRSDLISERVRDRLRVAVSVLGELFDTNGARQEGGGEVDIQDRGYMGFHLCRGHGQSGFGEVGQPAVLGHVASGLLWGTHEISSISGLVLQSSLILWRASRKK